MKSHLIRIGVVLAAALWLSACASGHCRGRKADQAPAAVVPPSAVKEGSVSAKGSDSSERVFVYKYDGSLQCNQGAPVPVEQMAQQLKGIEIFSREKKPDGLMHIQVCGSPTGMANVYEIAKSDLSKAEKAGFKLWTFE